MNIKFVFDMLDAQITTYEVAGNAIKAEALQDYRKTLLEFIKSIS